MPFCRQKCPYCSFYSFPPQRGDFDRFLQAVCAHLHLLAQEPLVQALQFDTIFFGGGTPSLLPPTYISQILHTCRSTLHCAAVAEISIEVNPGTIDAFSLCTLQQAGCNRLSLGVQSFLDQELKQLGRVHSAQDAVTAVLEARRAGFNNISLDLMYGLPGQRLANWRLSLEQALSLAPEHLSLYELTPEEPSPLYQDLACAALTLPHEDEVLAMMDSTAQLIADSSLVRYEISNYARPGHICRHNINYWQNGSYLGLGPGAVSALQGRRYRIPPGLARYQRLACTQTTPWLAEEQLDVEQSFRESVVMGLRMLKGVSAGALSARYQLDLFSYYGTVLDRLLSQGLLCWQGERLALTEQGLPLANQVMAELV